MTAARVMDVIALQVCYKFQSECPDLWIHLPRHNWPKSWSSMDHERNLYGHPLAAVLSERQLNEVVFGLGWGKIPNWERMFVHRKQVLFLSEYVDDIKLAGF